MVSHQDLRFQRPACYCCTTAQLLRKAVKVAWPDCPRAIEPRFIGVALFRWDQRRKWRGAESPDHFVGCTGMKSARVDIFCIHRRKCHLAGAFAPSTRMVWRDLRMGSGGDVAMVGYWTPWMTSWLLVERVRAREPATGAATVWAYLQDRCLCCSAKPTCCAWGMVGSPGVAPGPSRLRVECTVCQYSEP